MGLGGLALAWQRAETAGLIPFSGISTAILTLACLVSLTVLLGYALKVRGEAASLARDLLDPALVTFMAGIPVALMIYPSGLLPLWPGFSPLYVPLWWLGVVLHGILAVWLICRWLRSPGLMRDITPAWFVPTVGMVVAPAAGVPLGYWSVSAVALAAAALMWVVLLPMVVWRLAWVSPLLPVLVPTLFVLIAPPALFASGLHMLGASDAATATLFFIALVFAVGVLVMLAARRADIGATGFTFGWWGATFPLAALAGAGIHYHAAKLTAASHLLALGLLAFATLLIAAVSIMTVRTIILRR